MMAGSSVSETTIAAGFVAAGFAFGAAYFAALRRTVEIHCRGAGALRVAALTLGRLVAATGFFVFVAHWGALPLLAALAGLLAVRAFAVRAVRSHAA